jgi:hypothetical protein
MRKFVLVCAILFFANVGCKKMNMDGGGGLCGCSPAIPGTQLNLVIKNTANNDLLDEKVAGAYTKDMIQLYRKDSDGKVITIPFGIQSPFSYGNEKFNFYQLTSFLVYPIQNSANRVVFLKVGEKTYELTLQLVKDQLVVERLLIDQKETEKEDDPKFPPIFYLTQ